MQEYLEQIGQQAQGAAQALRTASTQAKNQALELMAEALLANVDRILEANAEDIALAKVNQLSAAMVERLTLTPERIEGMAQGLRKMATLPDPLAQTDREWLTDNGLRISRRRVPLGVIGIIYESRPNVTVDATGLTIKAGNAVILRGGKEALQSNEVIVDILQAGLAHSLINPYAVQLIRNPSREMATEFMRLDTYVDCLIPRGGAGLIQAVKKIATIPIIETGVGNCHLYVHEDANPEMAERILINGKTQRTSVCNALESLVIDRTIAETVLPRLVEALYREGVEVRGEEELQALVTGVVPAREEDYANEFLDLVIAVKIVDGYAEAIRHIEKYSTHHSDAIVTENYQVAQAFMRDVDAAAVYVNASTRFSDGEIFGFGGEIGISTQKLHARGPMGLDALTSYKYVVQGDGQIR